MAIKGERVPYWLKLVPDHLDLENRPKSLPKRSNSSLYKLEIISEDMANNGAFWILDCSCCQHPFLFGIWKVQEGGEPAFTRNYRGNKIVKPVCVSQKLLVRLFKGVKMLLCDIFSGLIERNLLKFFEISLSGQ